MSATQERKNKVSYFYHGDIGLYHYGPHHPMKPHRIAMTHSLVTNYGLYKKMAVHSPVPATFLEMAKVC